MIGFITARGRKGQSGRRTMRRGAVLALLGLLFHALMPLLLTPAANAAPSLLADALIICTPSGLASLADGAAQGDPDERSHSGAVLAFVCPVCIAGHCAGLATLSGLAEISWPDSIQRSDVLRPADNAPADFRLAGSRQPRAPPILLS